MTFALIEILEELGVTEFSLKGHPTNEEEFNQMFQKAIGDQNLLAKFDAMADDPTMQTSLAEMEWYKRNGMKDVEPKSFPHYKRIAREFDRAKKRAWASLKNDNDVQNFSSKKGIKN